MGDNEFNIFKDYYQPNEDFDKTRFYDEQEEDEAILVNQHLTPEQYQYEFPSKQYLKELEYLDINQESCFFDESSFITVYSSVDQMVVKQDQEIIVDDSRLSPLQLPAQIIDIQPSLSDTSYTLIRPVGPSSFLSDKHHMSHVTPSRDLQKENDMESLSSYRTKVILIQLNKTTMRSCSISDEGYDDTEVEEKELESQVTFYPLSEEEEEEEILIRDQAAIKIQSAWRGYHCRRNLKTPNPFVYNLAHQFHLRNVHKKVATLELQLRQETAMRMAFEKAMEDMTVLIDQQQKVLYDRLEQEVHLRQMYENKINQTLPNLENKLKKEMTARSKLEDMMTRVLDQLHESESARIEQSKQQAEIQSKLDLLLAKQTTTGQPPKKIISNSNLTKTSPLVNNKLTTQPATKRSPSSTTVTSKPKIPLTTTTVLTKKSKMPKKPTNSLVQNKNASSHIMKSSSNTKNLLVERPSVIPSNRKSARSINPKK